MDPRFEDLLILQLGISWKRHFMSEPWMLPSGNRLQLLLKIAIEIVSLPIQKGCFFHNYVSLPEGAISV